MPTKCYYQKRVKISLAKDYRQADITGMVEKEFYFQ